MEAGGWVSQYQSVKETNTKSQFDKSVLGKQEIFSRLIQAGLVEFPATGGNHDHDHDRDDDDLENDDDYSIFLLSICPSSFS